MLKMLALVTTNIGFPLKKDRSVEKYHRKF